MEGNTASFEVGDPSILPEGLLARVDAVINGVHGFSPNKPRDQAFVVQCASSDATYQPLSFYFTEELRPVA